MVRTRSRRVDAPFSRGSGDRPRVALAVAVLAFFVVTLDAVVVNVALPSVRADLGGGVRGLQWVVDGYTLPFAALLLSAGSLVDRVGAKQAIGGGVALFILASAACGVAPSLWWLVTARVAQGAAAAVMMPASLALIQHAYPDPGHRRRAVGKWAMGAAVASSSGPVVGGVLTLLDWRLIFLVNVPVGAAALYLLRLAQPSSRLRTPLDLRGQVSAVLAMTGLTYGLIEAGAEGFGSVEVEAALALAVLASFAFVYSEARSSHPVVPRELARSRTVSIALIIGFAFMFGFFGLPFLYSLYLQQERGLSALDTGLAFLPMMLIGLLLTPGSARITERFGSKSVIAGGLGLMSTGLLVLALLPIATPVWVLSVLMTLVGVGGPLVMPPTTSALLNSVPSSLAGSASGMFNSARQVGGVLAVALFGALLARPAHVIEGLRVSLLIAAAAVLVAALASTRLSRTRW